MLLAFMGSYAAVLLFPMFFIFHITGLEVSWSLHLNSQRTQAVSVPTDHVLLYISFSECLLWDYHV